jgi:Ca-activated chloride channel family protein
MDFENPLLLYAAPVVALVFTVLAFWVRRTRVKRASLWSSALSAEAASHGNWGIPLIGLVSLFAIVALAGPRWGTRVVETETKGLDLVIAVDISRSMLAEDTEPSRLERAKREARRLIHDLSGDRIGLVAFAGQSYVMSPLTVDGSALNLLVDALDPDVASSGGSALSLALGQGHELLLAGDDVADRILVVFTDGEAHDSLPEVIDRAENLRRDGVHLVLVAEGGRDGVRIPVREFDGELVGYQLDPGGEYVETRRRDDILTAVADAAQGVLVSAEVGDQAGRVRDLVAAFKRTPLATTTAAQDISRAWVPIMVAITLLLLHTITRRTTALAGLFFALVFGTDATAQNPKNNGDEAWLDGRFERAAALYRLQALAGQGGDTTWFNVGTAALASGDTALARQLVAHLDAARSHYQEALLLRPSDSSSKWNLELANLMMPTPPNAPPDDRQNTGAGQEDSPEAESQGLSVGQAEQILNSIAEEERRTLMRRNRNRSQIREARGRRDW